MDKVSIINMHARLALVGPKALAQCRKTSSQKSPADAFYEYNLVDLTFKFKKKMPEQDLHTACTVLKDKRENARRNS